MKKESIFSVLGLLLFFGAAAILNSCKSDEPNTNSPENPSSLTAKSVIINGVTWATCNLDKPGTFAATPESSGMFYQWNRKIGWSANDPLINSDGGTQCDATMPQGSEWTTTNDPSPAGWRVPNYDELRSLIDTAKVNITWTQQNGVFGELFTDKTSGKSLFLPAAGFRDMSNGGELIKNFYVGFFYWFSPQYNNIAALCLFLDLGDVYDAYTSKMYALPIRCVEK